MKTLKIYHGTSQKHIDNIKENGLSGDERLGNQWYMVATDFESALFHASVESKNDNAIVVEFEVPIEDHKIFSAYPHLHEPHVRNKDSSWHGIDKEIPPNLIKKIHQVSYDDYMKQKSAGFDKPKKKLKNKLR
jgi:hypothetical protein